MGLYKEGVEDQAAPEVGGRDRTCVHDEEVEVFYHGSANIIRPAATTALDHRKVRHTSPGRYEAAPGNPHDVVNSTRNRRRGLRCLRTAGI